MHSTKANSNLASLIATSSSTRVSSSQPGEGSSLSPFRERAPGPRQAGKRGYTLVSDDALRVAEWQAGAAKGTCIAEAGKGDCSKSLKRCDTSRLASPM